MLIFSVLLFIIPMTCFASEQECVYMYVKSTNPNAEFPDQIAASTVAVSHRTGLPVPLLLAIQKTESYFDPFAVSNKKAFGLMQIHYPTWQGLYPQKVYYFAPVTNILAGAVILRHYIEMENGNLEGALYRYYGARDTSYIRKVLKAYMDYLKFKKKFCW